MTQSGIPTRSWPDDRPELMPLLPLVLSVWMDGVLSATELSALRAHIDGQSWLDQGSLEALASWLDSEREPTAAELQSLRARVRSLLPAVESDQTRSLADLGLALWAASGEDDGRWSDATAVEGLRALEESLGVLGAEAARRIAGVGPPRVPERHAIGLDPEQMADFFDRSDHGLRARVREVLLREELTIPLGLPTDEYRERVLLALRYLAEQGLGRSAFPKEYGGASDPGASVAVFETLAFGDLSVLVKFGVQFGLFGGSIYQLGTERHHAEYLERVGTLDLPGCYAMTETGHGSNVRDLETTATYDPATDELVVHTPSETAGKDWIGNAARHGVLATVFARLVVAGEDHGVHAVLVPIRDDAGDVRPGVRIEDRGLKLGLNGVDNGRIWFTDVRVPRANLLDRFGSIDEGGRYHSPIASSGRRFFTMLRTLVAGRVSIAAASVTSAKVGLTIAIRYASERTQFGPKDSPEVPILDYPLVQRALLPRLATTIGLHFAVRALQAQYADADPAEEAELEVGAAGLKAYASDHCVETLQACREACGGQGYLAENRFAALKADSDIFTTFEGANAVLYQLVSKGLLSRFRDQMGELDLWRALQYLGERAETSITELNPVITRRTDREHLLDPEYHAAALAYREERLLRSAAMRIRARLREGVDSFQAVTEVQEHLVTLAKAHVEAKVLTEIQEAVATAPSPGLSEALRAIGALYALARIEADRAWFLEAGYLEANKARAIRTTVGELCGDVREIAVELVDAFAVPEPLLPELVRYDGR